MEGDDAAYPSSVKLFSVGYHRPRAGLASCQCSLWMGTLISVSVFRCSEGIDLTRSLVYTTNLVLGKKYNFFLLIEREERFSGGK